jgi:hypothetical protein
MSEVDSIVADEYGQGAYESGEPLEAQEMFNKHIKDVTENTMEFSGKEHSSALYREDDKKL